MHTYGQFLTDFFKALGDLIFTGPTGTNVSDLRVLLIYHQ
jgi:hydroxypyruvate reductase/glycerate 2-kinase